MNEFIQAASDEVLKQLGFQDDQLEYAGKILRLREDKELTTQVTIDEVTNCYMMGRPVMDLKDPREITMSVNLNPELNNNEHKDVEERIKSSLHKRGIDPSELFSYCTKSYGIERENISISFGFYKIKSE